MQTRRMGWMPIRAGQDHLRQFARKGAIDALVELIWNGLDAEADLIEVTIETASLAGGDTRMLYVTNVTVADHGHGMSLQIAERAFPSLGDSWKKTLNGRTVNGKRPLHGSAGRGRFYAYSLGDQARWTSVARVGAAFETIEIIGDVSQIDGFTLSQSQQSPGPTGTVVEIRSDQQRHLHALLREDVALQVAMRLAPHLLGNKDLTVLINGNKVDPEPLIDGDPFDVQLDTLAPEDLDGREYPALTVVDWKDEIRQAPGIVLCNEQGVSLIELADSALPGPSPSTAYLKWSGWAESAADLTLTQFKHPAILDAARRIFAQHVAKRTEVLTATIVTQLRNEGSYPYPDETPDPLRDTERQMFDLVAVTARSTFRTQSRQQRKMSAQLLQVVLQDRPDDLARILTEALQLTAEEREQLADMLSISSLGAIVRAAAEVTRRLDLLSALRTFVYSPDVSAELREVDQLHPLVKDNVWIFGEEWRLSGTEMGLTAVLRATVPETVALEPELVSGPTGIRLPDGRRGRVDLLLNRVVHETNERTSRLVIELKRPSVDLGFEQLAQVEGYAQALATHPGVGPSRWAFWLVGSAHKPEIEGSLSQQGREWGHVIQHETYDVRLTTWGRLIDAAEHRLNFYREQLRYDIGQDQAVERVRRRHAELQLPPPVRAPQ